MSISNLPAPPDPAPQAGAERPRSGDVVAKLKSALLAKDKRIEQLELTNRRLADQLADALAAGQRRTTAAVAHAAEIDPIKPAVRDADTGDWKLPMKSDGVMAVARARGIHSDNWAEKAFQVPLRSDRPLHECTLELWLNPDSHDVHAQVVVMVDGTVKHQARLNFGELNTLKFPLEVDAEKVFVLDIACDYSKSVAPPDRRVLSYVLRSMTFA